MKVVIKSSVQLSGFHLYWLQWPHYLLFIKVIYLEFENVSLRWYEALPGNFCFDF